MSNILERLVEAEAGNQGYEGKLAVAKVVLNRVRHDDFPNTIEAVITQEGQFTPVANGAIDKVTPTKQTKKAVQNARQSDDTFDGALYFQNPETTSSTWVADNRPFIRKIKDHAFYA